MQTFKFTLTNWNGAALFSHFSSCQLVVHLSHSIHHRSHSMPQQQTHKKNKVSQEHVALCLVFLFVEFFHCMGNCEQQTHKFTQKHYFSANSVVVVAAVVVADSFLFLFHLLLQSNCFHQTFHIDGLQSIKGILAYYTYIKQSAQKILKKSLRVEQSTKVNRKIITKNFFISLLRAQKKQ